MNVPLPSMTLGLGWLFSLPAVRTPRDLQALNLKTYIMAVAVAVAFLGIAALVSNWIAYEGGPSPSDPKRRRVWFWAVLASAVSVFFFYQQFFVMPSVAVNLKARFMTTTALSSGLVVIAYGTLGFLIARIFPKGKLGNWFPSR